jgi:hypothetical protein
LASLSSRRDEPGRRFLISGEVAVAAAAILIADNPGVS